MYSREDEWLIRKAINLFDVQLQILKSGVSNQIDTINGDTKKPIQRQNDS